MKSFNFFLIGIFIFFSNSLFSQDKYFSQWKKEVCDKANTAKSVNYLTETEKEVIYLMNLARLDGALFSKTYLNKFFDQGNNKTNSYAKSLIVELSNLKGLSVLYSDKQLFNAASFHATDIGKAGLVSHNSTDGTTFSVRVRKYKPSGCLAENCQFGYNDALSIVCDLLIDEGIESLGHRINILNPSHNSVGVAIREHKEYGVCCVQDFCCETGEQ